MIAFTDQNMFRLFGSTWLHNLKAAGVDYWVLAVTDNRTAEMVGGRDIRQRDYPKLDLPNETTKTLKSAFTSNYDPSSPMHLMYC